MTEFISKDEDLKERLLNTVVSQPEALYKPFIKTTLDKYDNEDLLRLELSHTALYEALNLLFNEDCTLIPLEDTLIVFVSSHKGLKRTDFVELMLHNSQTPQYLAKWGSVNLEIHHSLQAPKQVTEASLIEWLSYWMLGFTILAASIFSFLVGTHTFHAK